MVRRFENKTKAIKKGSFKFQKEKIIKFKCLYKNGQHEFKS